MTDPAPIYIDATTMYRWRDLAPVGIVRLERLLASHLRFRADLGPVQYVLWDGGYRPTDPNETARLDTLLEDAGGDAAPQPPAPTADPGPQRRSLKATVRRTGLKTIGRLPEHLRPFAEQAIWSSATFAVESTRHVRRAREQRKAEAATRRIAGPGARHAIDFSGGGDLVALGLGWEYIDHEAMYLLRQEHGVRIHMPAFDLIPITMPQMNAGQSHLVHRYYAEMAHYADSITSISEATTQALRQFYAEEGLPIPFLATNPLPGFQPRSAGDGDPDLPRHRYTDQPFVLTVSTIEIRKNHLLLAKIWAECIRQGHAMPKLVIVGRIGWDVDELLRWVRHAPELRNSLELVVDVDDDELSALYTDALFTVFPSRIEGWGLPITESMTHGKVCVHSTDPAQLEASQGLMPALHPDDFVAWKQEIVRLVDDAEYRRQLEDAISRSYVRRTADDYCARFGEILSARRGGGA